MSSEQFQLVLEGLKEDSSDSLRKVKGALLADLGLSVSEAQAKIDSLPATLMSTPHEDTLTKLSEILTAAGATVRIVRPKEASVEPLGEAIDFFLEATPTAKAAPSTTKQTEVLETGLDFFVDSPLPSEIGSTNQGAPPQPEVAPTSSSREGSPTVETQLPIAGATVNLESLERVSPPATEEAKSVSEPPPSANDKTELAPGSMPADTPVAVPVATPTPATAPRVTDSPHNLPIGRRMGEKGATPKVDPTDSNPLPPMGPSRTKAVTAEALPLIIGGTILLGILNWILYRL